MKIAIAGTGYVGLVTGVCLASKGHKVACVDVDENKIILLNSGKSPIYELGLEALMKENKSNIIYTTDYEFAYENAEVIFIGVGTPEKKDGSANLTYIYDVAKKIANSVKRDCVVVVKSTVPIGTNDKIEDYIKRHLKSDVNVYVASNPEFLAQGTAVKDTLEPSRIVLGTESKEAEHVLREVYENFDAPLLATNRRSAEMIKYASNDFLALKISYINEIANLCEIVGADIEDVTYGMGFDSRIGNKFLKAGIGYGGSCFPKDTKALNWLSAFNGNELKTIRAAIDVNEMQKFKLIKKARNYFDDLKGVKVAILGLTFKPETDDLREAPSLVNIPYLLEEGAVINAWDPIGIPHFEKQFPEKVNYFETIEDTIEDTELCFIFTEWKDVLEFNIENYKKYMKTPIILDGRNCYELERVQGTGIIYDSIGRKVIK